jgi:thiol-disulfide isomerase/thioredoxin
MKKIIVLFGIISFFQMKAQFAKSGKWQANIATADNKNIPVYFDFKNEGGAGFKIEIVNGEERIPVENFKFMGDSVSWNMLIFNSSFKLKFTDKYRSKAAGTWYNNVGAEPKQYAVDAMWKEDLVSLPKAVKAIEDKLTGKWEVLFNTGKEDAYPAVGIFKQSNEKLTGTFRTETGDYRYLSGFYSGKETFYLSCFDGSHAYLFEGKLMGDSIKGMFYFPSGSETWEGRREESANINSAYEMTKLKSSKDKELNFEFKNLAGKKTGINAPKYLNKPVIIQLMGSWCPNCIDETKYLVDLHSRYTKKGMEIIAVSFEKTTDFKKVQEHLTKLKTKLGIKYEILITELTGKDAASEAFPTLTGIKAFPTTIYLNAKHQVVKIHTGFNGPATGEKYEEFKAETESLINELITEAKGKK